MPRILLLILFTWVLYVVLKRFMRFIKQKEKSPHQAPSAEKIVACQQCGLHVPESETRVIDNVTYCLNTHCHPPQ